MTRVDFAFGAADRLRTACKAVHKQYLAGRPIVVYSREAPLLERFDQLLWGVEPTAFIPHVYADDPLAAQTPVLLTLAQPNPAAGGTQATWLLNLDTQCPPTSAQFERVLEIVSLNEDDVSAARERWKQYKAEGHDVRAHDLAARR